MNEETHEQPGVTADVESLQLPELERFATTRRHVDRLAMLDAGGREVDALPPEQVQAAASAMKEALGRLRTEIERLRPLLEEHLGDAIGPAVRNAGIEDAVRAHGHALGFSRLQIDWLWGEVRKLENASAVDLLPNGVDDLLAILEATAASDDILAAGFLHTTGNEALDTRVRDIAARFGNHGVIASAYLVLCLALVAVLFVKQSTKGETNA